MGGNWLVAGTAGVVLARVGTAGVVLPRGGHF